LQEVFVRIDRVLQHMARESTPAVTATAVA